MKFVDKIDSTLNLWESLIKFVIYVDTFIDPYQKSWYADNFYYYDLNTVVNWIRCQKHLWLLFEYRECTHTNEEFRNKINCWNNFNNNFAQLNKFIELRLSGFNWTKCFMIRSELDACGMFYLPYDGRWKTFTSWFET